MQEQNYFDENPLKSYVQHYADYSKNYMSHDFIAFGRYGRLQIPDAKKQVIEEDVNRLQAMCLPTLAKLRNNQNIAQLQDRIYRKLKLQEDKFNDCFSKARTPSEGDYCLDQLHQNLSVKVMEDTKKILEEYWSIKKIKTEIDSNIYLNREFSDSSSSQVEINGRSFN